MVEVADLLIEMPKVHQTELVLVWDLVVFRVPWNLDLHHPIQEIKDLLLVVMVVVEEVEAVVPNHPTNLDLVAVAQEVVTIVMVEMVAMAVLVDLIQIM